MQLMTENKVVPKLRFGEFQDEWKKQSLGKLTVKVNKKNKDNISYPIYSINNVEGFLPQSEQFEGLDSNDRKYDISIYKIVQPKTFAYNPARINVGSIGYSYDLRNIIISSLYICFKTKEELDDSYLGIYLKTYNFNKDILRYQEGGVRQYLFYENFSMINIPLPSLTEQQKIVSFLNAVDEKLQQLTKKKELLKEYNKGVMQRIFSQEVRFKDNNGNNFPDWEKKMINDMAFCLDNKRKPLNSSERNKIQGDIPYYGANGIVDYVNEYLFNEELVLLAEDGGKFFDFLNNPIAQLISGKSWVNNHAHILKAKIEVVTTDFLFYSLVHKDIRKFITGGSRVKLNKSDLMSIRMTVPCIEEQQKIANFLSAIDGKIKLVSTQIDNITTFKKGLLQQMFV